MRESAYSIFIHIFNIIDWKVSCNIRKTYIKLKTIRWCHVGTTKSSSCYDNHKMYCVKSFSTDHNCVNLLLDKRTLLHIRILETGSNSCALG